MDERYDPAPERRRFARRFDDPGHVPPTALATTDSLKVQTRFGEITVTGQFAIIIGLMVGGFVVVCAMVAWQAHLMSLDQDHTIAQQHIIMDRETIVMNTVALCTGAEHLKAQFEATDRQREASKAKRDLRRK